MIKMILCCGAKGELGYNNNLVFKIKDDLKRFKELTINNTVLMGRKTFESLGKPLPKRHNVVLTSNMYYGECHMVNTTDDLEAYVKFHKKYNEDKRDLFIIGGANVYQQAIDLDLVDEIYLTHVDSSPEDCDTYFDIYQIINSPYWLIDNLERGSENGLDFVYIKFTKDNN